MHVTKTKLDGVMLIQPKVFIDERGFFKETFQAERYAELGIDQTFVQDNYSSSLKGVLRGLHLQKMRPQGKLVSCIRGAIYDVAVDVCPYSNTFGEYVGFELTEENHLQLWIPPGYAHGFCVLSDVADFQYKCTDLYCPEDEGGLIWNDPDVDIDWPIQNPQLSEKDRSFPSLQDIKSAHP